MVHIELYGVPRLRAGTARLTVEGRSIGEVLGALARACPALARNVLEVQKGLGRVQPAYRFVSDAETPLAEGDTLLLLAADVGG